MRRSLLVLPFLLLLVLAPPAAAGGWATVGLSSTPSGVEPGQPWNVDLTILQHGRTPLQGVSPSITIVNGATRQSFSAKATAEPGVYRTQVVFPTAGAWRYEVDDGFISGQPHTFPAVRIGDAATAGAAAAADDGGGPPLALLIPGLVLLAAAAAVLLVGRRRPGQSPQAA